jgi:hypothetical protein
MVSKNDIKFMNGFRSQKNKPIISVRLLQHPHIIDTVIVRDIKQMLLYDWCNAVNQKNILQRPCSKMPAAPAPEAKPTPYRNHIIKIL